MLSVLYSFPLRMGTTGIGMTAWHQVNGLIQAGVKVYLCCGSLEKKIDGLSSLYETLKPMGIKLPIRPVGSFRAANIHDFFVSQYVKKISHTVDVVHCWPSGSLQSIKMVRKKNIPSILERPSAHTRYVYEIMKNEWEKLGLSAPRKHYATYNDTKLQREENEFQQADVLLCPSSFCLSTHVEYGLDQKKIYKHHYGFDPKIFNKKKNDGANHNKKFTLLYVGQCSPLKGIHYALKAWKISNVSEEGRFLIYGDIVEEFYDIIKEDLNFHSVEYCGFSDEISKVMMEADALVLPSLAEGSALVTYEAIASGCFLFLSTASGDPCDDGVNCLYHSPRDYKTLARQIDYFYFNRSKMTYMSDDNIQKLSWDSAGKRLAIIYKQILDNAT